jgi:uncharacterized protein (TIGR02391 family)
LGAPPSKKLTQEQTEFIEYAASEWDQTDEWPRRTHLLLRARKRRLDFEAMLSSLPHDFWDTVDSGNNERIRLTPVALERTTLREKVVEPFLTLIRLAVKRRLENPYETARVGYDDLLRTVHPRSTRALERLAHYFQNYWVGGSSSGYNPSRPDDYQLYGDLRILTYEGVKSSADVWQRRSRFHAVVPAQKLTRLQKTILRTIHRRWQENQGEWPKMVDVVIELHSRGDVLSALQSLPTNILMSHFSTIDQHLHTSRLQLRLDGILIAAPEAEPRLMARAFPVLLEHFTETEGSAPMKAEDLATRVGAPLAQVLRLKDLFELDGWTGVHIIPQGPSSWVAAIDDAILKMEGVTNLKGFLRKRKAKEQSEARFASEQLYAEEDEAAIAPTQHDHLACRQIHHLVIDAAGRLYRQGHYDEAVERAFKKLASRVKRMTKRRDVDGVDLMNQAFSVDRPILRLNPLQTKFERGEQIGWMNLFAGVMGALRNPVAHDTSLTEQEALDRLTIASVLNLRLDSAKRTRTARRSN